MEALRARLAPVLSEDSGPDDPDAWRKQAACRDTETDLFFPIGRSNRTASQEAMAKLVCQRCEVASDCLAFALSHDCAYGVFGGTTEQERRAIRHGLLEVGGRARNAG
jgi:WhiB family redox-sensing transcriptional regulator